MVAQPTGARDAQYWSEGGRASRVRSCAWLRSALASNALLAWVTAGYAAAWFPTALVLGAPPFIPPVLIAQQLGLFLFLFLCYSLAANLVLGIRSRACPGASGPLPSYLNLTSAASALLAITLCALFMAVFTMWKNLIPLIHPFAWDAELMRLDRWLHGGDPWRLIQPLAGHRPVTYFLDFVYGPVWFVACAAMLAWAAWSKDRSFRRRFYFGFVVLWIGLGTIAATALSSAGPAFYHHIEPGEQPFLELLAYLESTESWVVEVQHRLWGFHVAGAQRLTSGISAAPSLHIAQPALFAFLTWRTHRPVAWIMIVLTALVLLATVHLAWHYAVDGYMAIVGAFAIARLASWQRRPVDLDATRSR